MERKTFLENHPLASKILLSAGFVATLAVGAFIVPRMADKLSAWLMTHSASIDIPDDGPEIIRNTHLEDR